VLTTTTIDEKAFSKWIPITSFHVIMFSCAGRVLLKVAIG